jgi:glycosyltransferase involved in cell wall biosynthesis
MITVVIPVHNREHLIARAIGGVVAQNLVVDEIIVVDDASTDRTVDIVKDLARSLAKLRLVTLEENVGAARARNIGIKNARGDLIAFLDSDDMWYANKLTKQVAELNINTAAVAVFCGVVIVNEDTKERYRVIPKPIVTQSDLYNSNPLMTMSCALMHKRTLLDIGGFDETLPSCQDWDLFIRLSDCGQLLVVQEELVEIWLHKGDRISRHKPSVLAGHELLFEKIYKRISDSKLKQKVRASYEMRMADIFSERHFFEPRRAVQHLCKGLMLAPSREGLNVFRRVVKSLLKNVIFQSKK